jgi:hypothetical protein
MGIDWTLESFMAESRFDNFMTKRIAGSYDLRMGKRYLDEKFSFIGFTDRIDESLVLMRNQLNWHGFDLNYELRNASKNPNYSKDTVFKNKILLKEIEKRNELDIQLYNYALHNIYPIYRNSFSGDFEKELHSFRARNINFSFSKMKITSSKVYRWSLYRNVEYILMCLYHKNYGKRMR